MDTNRALEILGLPLTATPGEIKEAYRDLTKVWHPDRFVSEPRLRAKAEETIKSINEAYQVLQGRSTGLAPGTSGSTEPPRGSDWSTGARTTHPASSARWARVVVPPPSAAASPRGPALRWLSSAIAVAGIGLIGYAVIQPKTGSRVNQPSASRTSEMSQTQRAVASAPGLQARVGAASHEEQPPREPRGSRSSVVPQRTRSLTAESASATPIGSRVVSKALAAPGQPPVKTSDDGDGVAATKDSRPGESRPVSPGQHHPASERRPRAPSESYVNLGPEEMASLVAACSQTSYIEGPGAHNQCIEDQLARLGSAPRRPDLSNLSATEQQSVEAACSPAKYLEGPAAYNRCLREQLDRWVASPPRPDLSGLAAADRDSIEAACSQARYVEGPATYNRCLRDQVARSAAAPKRPGLSDLSASERQSIEAACAQKWLEGATGYTAAYNRCLQEQLDRWAASPPRPDLSGLATPERESILSACSQSKYLEGAAAYSRCLRDQLALLATAPKRPDLSDLSATERQSIEAACSQARHFEGPSAYNKCLIGQVARLKDLR
jgi:hypothetical protein